MADYLAQNLKEVNLVAAGIDASSTSLVLTTGSGALLVSTSGTTYQYPLAIYDSRYSAPHLDPNVEIVLVTSHDGSSDTLTVTRGQESTSAVAHNTSGVTYKAVAGFTKAMFDFLDDGTPVSYQTAPVDSVGAISAGANPTPYVSLQVVCGPVILQAQTISKVIFNVTNSSFAQVGGDGVPYIAVGLYDSSGNLLIDGTWQDVELAGNKIKTLASSVTIKTGHYILAWAGRFTASGTLFTVSYENTTRVPFMNFDAVVIGTAANAATSPSGANSAAMPSTLGAISAPGGTVTLPVTIFT